MCSEILVFVLNAVYYPLSSYCIILFKINNIFKYIRVFFLFQVFSTETPSLIPLPLPPLIFWLNVIPYYSNTSLLPTDVSSFLGSEM